MAIRKRLYFFESQIPMAGVVYLPYVSGLLQGYAQTFEIIRDNYDFQPFIFIRDSVENIMKKIYSPDVMAFSVCIWNHQISLAVAKAVKEKYPNCKILFGGPQPQKNDKEKYPFIDYIVSWEGEKQFVPLLGQFIGEKIEIPKHTIDDYPSPYSLGLYNRYFQDYPDLTFQAILETDRNCPFFCAFCFWGQNSEEKKIKYHSLEYTREEAEWIGQHKIKYVFLANANFGMYERDYEVAQIYCETKEKYGFPEKVRVCYGKNKEENVFRVASLMHAHELTKAVTLARQSNDEEALKNIRRSNIKLTVYDNLRDRYNAAGIPTYTEIILGMPGESRKSFIKGLHEIAGTPTQLFIYHCTVLPNTEMAEPDYIKKHGIKTVRVPLAEIHCEPRKKDFVQEYEDIIIETNTLAKSDWIECAVYAWEIQLKYVFGVYPVPEWVDDFFYRIALGITEGIPRAQFDPGFGNIYWEPEEMAFLQICLSSGLIQEDPKEFARKNVLWGRKSKVHGKKKMELAPQDVIDRRPDCHPLLKKNMNMDDST